MRRFKVAVLASMLGIGGASLMGCASHDTGASVPVEAMQVVSGGKVLAFTAPHDGRIYLRDESDKRLVYSSDIRRDQVVKYDPAGKSVMVDGKVVAEKVSDPDHSHSIFFERSDRADVVDPPGATSTLGSGSADIPVVRVPVGVQVDVQTQPANAQSQR